MIPNGLLRTGLRDLVRRPLHTGLMVLGIPCYVLFYVFSQFESPRKNLWIAGMLGLGGVAAFVIGAVILIDTEVPGFGIPTPLIVALGVVSAAIIAVTGGLALKARNRPVVSGSEELIGSIGEVLSCSDSQCWARVHSELWQVQGTAPLTPGLRVRVSGRDGLILLVTPTVAKGE